MNVTGAATYEMPIECPAGPNGIKPELKFVYNSQTSDGLMGCGWTINGLSSINRVPRTMYYDGKAASVDYTIDDALVLDGVRLVKYSSEGGNAEFRKENDLYTRIVGYEPTKYGYKYFKVFMKDGRTFTFSSSDSEGGGFGWPLTEICDANGNYITFQDITSYGGDMNSSVGRVIYGKNKSGVGSEIVIEFEFENSPNPVTQYVGGKAIEKWARLVKVRVLGNGLISTGEYSLTYYDSVVRSDRSRLSRISLSRDGVNLSSTNFSWTKNNDYLDLDNDIFDKVVKIEDGLHNTITIEYGKVTEIVKQAQTSFVQGLYKDVVSKVSRLNSNGDGTNVKYEYSDVLYDKNINRFMGYGIVKSTDAETRKEIENLYFLKESCLLFDGTIESVNGRKTKTVTNFYDVIVRKSGRIHTAILNSQIESDVLTGIEQRTDCKDVDSYGNPQKILIMCGSQIITHDISYIRLLDNNVSKPTRIKTTYSYGGKRETRERSMSYDEKGNITSETENGIVRRYMDYDVYGNYQTLQYGDGTDMRTEKYTYTPNGRHIESKTNALGEKTTYNWDEVKDQLKYETDAYRRNTRYYYDEFGVCINTIRPDGVLVSTKKLWAEEGNPYGAAYCVVERESGKGNVTTWFTSDGREVCGEQYGLNGKKVYVVKEYNNDGTVSRVSMPSYEQTPSVWAEQYTYDDFGRPVKILTAEGEMQFSYNRLCTTMTLNGDKVVKVMTPEGWIESVNTNGKSVRYSYYPTGEMMTATPEGGALVYMEYDKQGNRTQVSEADGGTVKKVFNAFGEIAESTQRQGKGSLVKTYYTYSPEGLLMQMNCGGMATNYMYDSQNRLIQKTMAGGVSQSYEYDKYDRILKTVDKIDGKEFVCSTSYDKNGLKQRVTYPSGYYIENVYDENGVLAMTKDKNGSEIYKPLDADASGHILKESRGGKVTAYTFDTAGRMTSKMSDGTINHYYAYDAKGNLTQFLDNLSGQKCLYTYDELNRLAEWQAYSAGMAKPVVTDKIKYDNSNNMISRSGLGDVLLAYDDAYHPHAVSSISGVPSAMSRDDQNITYTKFGKVESVNQGDRRYDITYSVNEDRIKTEYTTEKGKTTRYYAGDYEEVTDPHGNVTKFCYLPGGAMMVEKAGEQKLYYNYTDRLGSIVATADADGNVIERYAYDPWGARLNPDNWAEKDTRTSLFNNRGYTGHEHIDGLDLINMNGRMYDSMLGMFLSVDPLIQTPAFWLNYNRYLYGYGNPQKYFDPNGESVLLALAIGALVGVVVGGVVGYMYGCIQGAKGWNLFKYTIVGAGVGTVVGALCGAGFFGMAVLLPNMLLCATIPFTICAYVTAGVYGIVLTGGCCALDIYLTHLLSGLWISKNSGK